MSIEIHPTSLCESMRIGEGTRIGAFSRVSESSCLGANCWIGAHVHVEDDVAMGEGVRVGSGALLGRGLRIGNNVSIGPNATFQDKCVPDGSEEGDASGETVLEDGVEIGASATVLSGVTIGRNAIVGPGSVVAEHVPANAIVTGSPARIHGYADKAKRMTPRIIDVERLVRGEVELESKVRGVALYRLTRVRDLRGTLCAGEFPGQIPFVPRRFFVISDVPGFNVRGEHAHRTCEQFLVALRGSCSTVVDDGVRREEFVLSGPDIGLYLPPMTWGIQYKHTEDALLLVLASAAYDPDDYIRDYDEFLGAVSG